MNRQGNPFRLGIVASLLLFCAALGLPRTLWAESENSLSGTYKCATIEVSGNVQPCSAPSIELKSDGSYKLLSEVGSYEIVGGRWLVLSAAKRHGKARLTGKMEIIFEFVSHGERNRIVYRKKFQRPSFWVGS